MATGENIGLSAGQTRGFVSYYYRANTVGLLALLGNCLSFAAYLCTLQYLGFYMFFCRANTVGLLALLGNCLSFAVYLCILQQYLARRPHPFSAFLAASIVGGAGIAALAVREFTTASF